MLLKSGSSDSTDDTDMGMADRGTGSSGIILRSGSDMAADICAKLAALRQSKRQVGPQCQEANSGLLSVYIKHKFLVTIILQIGVMAQMRQGFEVLMADCSTLMLHIPNVYHTALHHFRRCKL